MARGVKRAMNTGGAGALKRSPPAPDWFSPAARAEWRRVVPTLIERGILTATDLGICEAYCVALAKVREIEALIQADPANTSLYRLQTQSTQVARQLATEIGATPVSRSRPTATDDAEPDDDPLGL
jgi:P27 family predicted phage terminase small subunit